MPGKIVDFIFDFASPNAYLSYHVLKGIAQERDASVRHIPCLLGGIFKATGNQAPMLAFGDIRGKLEYDMLETRRFVAKHKLDRFKSNPHFPVNSLRIIRGAIGAQRDGYLDTYLEKMLSCMWEQGLKMDEPAVISKAFEDAGFDVDRLWQQIQDTDVKQALIDNTEAAVARGAFGIPTFYVGDEMFFGKERLGQLADML